MHIHAVGQDELRELNSTVSAERSAASKAAAQQRKSSEELLAKKEVRTLFTPCCMCPKVKPHITFSQVAFNARESRHACT